MDIVVQPAVSWMDLNEQIKQSGLFFPIDPGPSVRHRPNLLFYDHNFMLIVYDD
jgi:FAD/FMN-containing dehydrogenase